MNSQKHTLPTTSSIVVQIRTCVISTSKQMLSPCFPPANAVLFAAVPFHSPCHACAAPRGGVWCAIQPQTALSRLVWGYWNDVSSRHFTGTHVPRHDIVCGGTIVTHPDRPTACPDSSAKGLTIAHSSSVPTELLPLSGLLSLRGSCFYRAFVPVGT